MLFANKEEIFYQVLLHVLVSLIYIYGALYLHIGRKYYYNTRTRVSQWEHPISTLQSSSTHAGSGITSTGNSLQVQMPRCLGCGGWGLGLVQSSGYCNHCTRYDVYFYE